MMRYTLDENGEPICKTCDEVVLGLLSLSALTLVGAGVWAVWAPSELVGKIALTAFIVALVSSILYSKGGSRDA